MCSKYRQHSKFNSEHNGKGLCENLHFKMYHKDVSPAPRHSKYNLPSYSQWESIVIDMNPKGSEILLQYPEGPSTWIVRIFYKKNNLTKKKKKNNPAETISNVCRRVFILNRLLVPVNDDNPAIITLCRLNALPLTPHFSNRMTVHVIPQSLLHLSLE